MGERSTLSRRILAAAILAAIFDTARAGSTLETVQHAAEVALPALELPGAEGGILELAACGGCETRSLVVAHGTSYLVNGRPTSFAQLAAAVLAARAAGLADRSLVALYFDAASKRLVRIALVAPTPP